MTEYLRGQMAKMANVNMETLRYYEELGLISTPIRSEAGYRLYSEEALSRLTFIHNAKQCGFTLKEIKKALLKSESSGISIDDFVKVVDKKMDRVRNEIAKQEIKLASLADLRTNLLAKDKHPGVQSTLEILKMES
ncbi:MerR family transcriptional regulator [Paenibacillus sp. FSL F4-0243]|uniref:MerR family transcriptional regulator n=1 Tax=Paenibacillus sp. FSL F4-0243 TaxID=2954732 RepID=UPI0030DDBC9C